MKATIFSLALTLWPVLLGAETETVDNLVWTYELLGGMVTVTGASGASGDITLPKTLGGQQVTALGDRLFYGNTKITSVKLPDTLQKIGPLAFFKCVNLSAVTFGGKETEIASHAFHGCSALTSVKLPPTVTVLADRAFGATGLTEVSLPSELKRLGNAFDRCRDLRSIVIPEGITRIRGWTFRDCSALTSVTFPSTLKAIDGGAFEGCTALASVDLPEGLIWIGMRAFHGCVALRAVKIPEGVAYVTRDAFSGCTALSSADLPKGLKRIGMNGFSSCEALEAIDIPARVSALGAEAFGSSGLAKVRFLGAPPHTEASGDGATAFPSGATGFYGPAYATLWQGVASEGGGWNGLKLELEETIPPPSPEYPDPPTVTLSAELEEGLTASQKQLLYAFLPTEATTVTLSEGATVGALSDALLLGVRPTIRTEAGTLMPLASASGLSVTVSAAASFAVTAFTPGDGTLTLCASVSVTDGTLPESYRLGGQVILLCAEALNGAWSEVQADASGIVPERQSDTEAVVSLTIDPPDGTRFFRLRIEAASP